MKLLTENQFLQCPVGTVFVKDDMGYGPLQIKGQSCGGDSRFYTHVQVPTLDADSSHEESNMFFEASQRPGVDSLPLDLYTEGRDGYYEATGDVPEYLVLEPHDVDALIERLQKARAGIDTYAPVEPILFDPTVSPSV